MLTGSGLATFDRDAGIAVDYQLVKQAVRQGIVRLDESMAGKLESGAFLTRTESDRLRVAVLEGLTAVATEARMSTAVLDNLYWSNRINCSNEDPACESCDDRECPFEDVCLKLTHLGMPLEITRYY
jgi:hypothetical protein